MTGNKFINYAHRGASHYAPENTFASFYKAIEMQANGIETDIQSTKDGVLVLHHDDTLKRICGIDKPVGEFTLKELRELDFGTFFDTKYEGEKIVTLIDFLSYFASKPITFAIEIKEEGIENEVLHICRKYLNDNQFYITSFYLRSILWLADMPSPPNLGFLSEGPVEDIAKILSTVGVKQFCPYAPSLDEAKIKYLRNMGFNIRAWGVGNEDIMRKAYLLGVDGMTVNFPAKLKELMETEAR